MAAGEGQHMLQPSLPDSSPTVQPETTWGQKHKEGLGLYEHNSNKWEQGGDITQYAALVKSVWECRVLEEKIWRWMINFGKGHWEKQRRLFMGWKKPYGEMAFPAQKAPAQQMIFCLSKQACGQMERYGNRDQERAWEQFQKCLFSSVLCATIQNNF